MATHFIDRHIKSWLTNWSKRERVLYETGRVLRDTR